MKLNVLSRVLVASLGMIATLFLFNNCGQDLPSEAKTYGSEAAPASLDASGPGTGQVVLTALNLTLSPSTIFTDQTARAVMTGGQAPYTYSIVSGTARIDATGAISGPLAAGTVVVRVADQAQQSAQVVLTVNARPVIAPPPGPGTPPPPVYASCTTPFGTTIAHGASITAFQTATIYCPSTAQCASETRVCNNGTLSGSYTASACSTRACVYKATYYTKDFYSGNILCAISYGGEGGSYSSIPQVASAAMLPPSCAANQYNASDICEVQSNQVGGGDSGYTDYNFTKYTCRGANENVTPQLIQYQNNSGN